MESFNAAKAEPGPGPSKKTKFNTHHSLYEATDDALPTPGPVTPANKLSEDELGHIFSSYWITTKDLMNFRLVNTTWRDTATTTLLLRDACCIPLTRKTATLQDLREGKSCFYKLRGDTITLNELSQLTDLISKSPKFPASNFRLHLPTAFILRHTDFPDLMLFLKLHGNKIKTLSLLGWITWQLLLDIFSTHIPDLEYLDLSEAQLMYSKVEEKNKWNALPRNSKILSLKSLAIGRFWMTDDQCSSETDTETDSDDSRGNPTDRTVVHWLLSSSPKLSSIDNVTLHTLRDVLRFGKGHLINSFVYKYCHASNYTSISIISTTNFNSRLTKFMRTNPKLTDVTLDMDFAPSLCSTDEPSLNAFIESFKDTVQNLELRISYNALNQDPLPRVKIPPMKNLKTIKLAGDFRENDRGYVIAELRTFGYKFQDEILAENYFPSLLNVTLNPRGKLLTEADLLSFFKFKFHPNRSSWDALPTVESLHISENTRLTHLLSLTLDKRTPKLSREIFPNIRVLKIKCGNVKNLDCSLWAMCQKVEFMELYDISSGTGTDTTTTTQLSLLVDKFFTGFPLGICRKLQTTELPQELDNPEMIKFLRTAESVCDLQNLRELKLQFSGKWSTEFASHVTGTYAFLKMPNTKFIISYNRKIFVSEIEIDSAQGFWKYTDSDDDDDESDNDEDDDDNDGEDDNDDDEDDNDDDDEDEDANDVDGDANDKDDNVNDENGDDHDDEDNTDDESDSNHSEESLIEDNEVADADTEEVCFGPIKPYVQIVYERDHVYQHQLYN